MAYLKSDAKFWKVDADAEATSKGLLAIVTETINADATGTVLIKGLISPGSLTAGDELYISTTSGTYTNTAPSATADIVRIIGYSLNTTTIYFDPDNTYIEI